MIASLAGRRIAVTGIGVVAPCGIGAKQFWDGLFDPADEREVDLVLPGPSARLGADGHDRVAHPFGLPTHQVLEAQDPETRDDATLRYGLLATDDSLSQRISPELWETIESVFVINDGSQDDTDAVVEKLSQDQPKIRLVSRQQPKASADVESKFLLDLGNDLLDGIQFAAGDLEGKADDDQPHHTNRPLVHKLLRPQGARVMPPHESLEVATAGAGESRPHLTRFFALSAVLFALLALGDKTPLLPLLATCVALASALPLWADYREAALFGEIVIPAVPGRPPYPT